MSRALTRFWGRPVERAVPAVQMPDVWFSDAAITAMQAEALRSKPRETGGMLLGYAVGAQIVVNDVIGPGPAARHRRWSFDPDGPWQRHELERIYEATGRMQTYLGDWHSHPSGGLHPSGRDLRTARHVATTPDAQTPNPLTVLLAPVQRTWTVGAWVFDGALFVPARLHPLSQDPGVG